MCVIVSHFTTLRHLVCQWDRHFLQAEVFLKCASLASHFHEMVCHMFDSNVRRWNVMVCHFLWRKVRHGIKMYDSHRYNDAPFPGVKRCVLQMTSALAPYNLSTYVDKYYLSFFTSFFFHNGSKFICYKLFHLFPSQLSKCPNLIFYKSNCLHMRTRMPLGNSQTFHFCKPWPIGNHFFPLLLASHFLLFLYHFYDNCIYYVEFVYTRDFRIFMAA